MSRRHRLLRELHFIVHNKPCVLKSRLIVFSIIEIVERNPLDADTCSLLLLPQNRRDDGIMTGHRTRARRIHFTHPRGRGIVVAECLACFLVAGAAAVAAAAAAAAAEIVPTKPPFVVRRRLHQALSAASRSSLLLAFVANPPASPARIAQREDLLKLAFYRRIQERGGCAAFLPPHHDDPVTPSSRTIVGAARVGSAARCIMTASSTASRDSTAPSSDPVNAPVSWLDRVEQLRQFKAEHGHTRVPKRDNNETQRNDGHRQVAASCRGLGTWVQRQRQVRCFPSARSHGATCWLRTHSPSSLRSNIFSPAILLGPTRHRSFQRDETG
jgi:Helicase associated domain